MSDRGSNSVMAFVLGAVAGGITALLLAPMSGRELRGRIGENAERARREALERAEQVRGKVVETYEQAGQKAREAVDEIKSTAETRQRAVKEAFKEGKAAYERELSKVD